MKRKTRKLMTLMIAAICCSFLLIYNTAKADETTAKVSRIEITKQPSWTSYVRGQNMNLSDMEITAYFQDGTNKVVTDYMLMGYNQKTIGNQTITVSYKDAKTTLTVRVTPPQVINVKASANSTTSITLTWDKIDGVKGYEIYSRNEATKVFALAAFVESNTASFEYESGTVIAFYVNAIAEIDGVKYTGQLSDKRMAATGPEEVTGLKVVGTTVSTISLSWDEHPMATGYMIYRTSSSSNKFVKIGSTTGTSYVDKSPASGNGYRYQVSAYTIDQEYTGTPSEIVEARTKLGKLTLNVKGGENKARVTWSRVSGAVYYDIYMANEYGDYEKLTTRGSTELEYIVEGLDIGTEYSFYGVARRNYDGITEESPASNKKAVTIAPVEATSKEAKLFADKKAFQASDAYQKIEFFRKRADFDKSFVIPGLINTNISGFASSSMCPQGLTFAEDYLLMTAYDMANQELSVIYVMSVKTRELLTTIILPTKAHVGGIGYDGTFVWVSVGNRVNGLSYEVIEEAVRTGQDYYYIEFESVNVVGITASYITYYNDMLWIGSYNELQTTIMNSYQIDHETEGNPTLTKVGAISMPTRVQGVAFTDDGTMILSRSCQLYVGLRGYMRQLDIYKPDFSDEEGDYRLGKMISTVEMPTMNEEIAIREGYLYVNFESAAFAKASYPVDRIVAFKLSSILKGK